MELVLHTPRLVLRPLDDSHVDALFAFASDPELPRLMAWSAHRDREETLAFVRGQIAGREAGTDLAWAIEHEGRLAGSIGLHGILRTLGPWRVDRGELGYWLGAPLRGRGLVTEAAGAVMRFGFGPLGLHKITVRCIEENLASKRVIEKAGFRFVGRAVDDLWRDGRWWSHLGYELTAPEWSARAG